jgi:hypothetical protein
LASWAQSRARPSQPLPFPSPFLHFCAAHEAAQPALRVAYSGPPDASVFLVMPRQSPSSRHRREGNPSAPSPPPPRRSSTESTLNQNENRIGLESVSITSCWNKSPYIRSYPKRFSPSQLSSNLSRHLSHRHTATCSPEPNRPPQEFHRRPTPLLVLSV